MANLTTVQTTLERKLNRQAARSLSMKNNAQAIIALAEALHSDPRAVDDIIDLANAISMDAEDLKTDLGSAVNVIADIHTLRIANNA
tara:strand:- start:986 stop:1246 length:261 start_codon:yes stop_codon:yes gene_type:complete